MAGSPDTMQDTDLIARLAGELEAGRPFALATVLATRLSMPRDAGARMALLRDGTFLGTVGGGRIEQLVQGRCEELLNDGAGSERHWYVHAQTEMACGGDALVGVRVVQPGELAVFQTLGEALANGEPVFIEERWPEEGFESAAIVSDPSELAVPIDAAATGTLWSDEPPVYIEAVHELPRVFVFGAGHVGRALVPVLASVGFVPLVFDDRPGIARPEDFPQAASIAVGDYVALAAEADVTPRDYVVVLTHGHKADIDVLEQVLPKGPTYAGCIGSARKRATVDRTLVERGVPEEAVHRLHLPIGDKISAVTPPEIAVSIAAQMIRHRASVAPRPRYCTD